MDGTRELVETGTVGMALAILSGVALVLVPVLLLLCRGSAPAKQAALLAGCAVLLFPLWQIYNLIEDHFGLDSVAALLINGALFVVVGVTAGLILRRLWPGEVQNSPRRHGDTELEKSSLAG